MEAEQNFGSSHCVDYRGLSRPLDYDANVAFDAVAEPL
jgi:hypothetical protein